MTRPKLLLLTLTSTFINIVIVFVLVFILADSIINYKTGFFILSPVIIALTFLIFYVPYIEIKKTKNEILKTDKLYIVFAIVYSVFNAIILAFNYYIWLDLFDGTTRHLLP